MSRNEHPGLIHQVLSNRQYLLVVLTAMFFFVAYYLTFPYISRVAAGYGAGYRMMGFCAAIVPFGAMFFRPFMVFFIKRISLKRLQILSLILFLIYSVGTYFSGNLVLYMVLLWFYGVGACFFLTANLTLTSKSAGKNHLGLFLGLSTALMNLMGIFFPRIGELWMDNRGNPFVHIVCSIVAIAALIITLFIQDEKKPEDPAIELEGRRVSFRDVFSSFETKALVPVAFAVLATVSLSFLKGFMAVYTIESAVGNAGVFYGTSSLITVLFSPFMGRLADRVKSIEVMIPFMLISIIGVVIVVFASSMALFVLGSILIALGCSTIFPFSQCFAFRLAGEGRQEYAGNTFYFGVDGAYALGPLIGGVLIGALGYRTAFLLAVVPLLLNIVLIAFKGRIAYDDGRSD